MAAGELAALTECPRCARPTQITLFPVFDRPATAGPAAEKVVVDGEATCFFHPQHRAYVPCDVCGRFLCALCDLNVQGRHLCPACLEAATRKNNLPSLEQSRTRWDQIVSLVLFLPLLVFCLVYFIPLTSLAALALIISKWKAPRSLVINTRVRFIVYAVVAILEFAFGTLMWGMIYYHRARRH
jgi:hypothetical protein